MIDRCLYVVRHIPFLTAIGYIGNESANNIFTLFGVRHFWVELNTVILLFFISYSSYWSGGIAGNNIKARWQSDYFVAMTHPNIQQTMFLVIGFVLYVFKQIGMTLRTNFCITKLTLIAGLYFSSQLTCHGLHAVTYTKNRALQCKSNLRSFWSIFGINRIGPT